MLIELLVIMYYIYISVYRTDSLFPLYELSAFDQNEFYMGEVDMYILIGNILLKNITIYYV